MSHWILVYTRSLNVACTAPSGRYHLVETDGVLAMRKILAITLACLLSFTAPVFAAELEVPPLVTKEAPPLPPVVPVAEFDWVPLVVGAVIAAGVIVCVLECAGHHNAAPIPLSPGAS
jgi:hypothetical protein